MSELKRAKILVIDDDPEVRSMVAETLAARGLEVHATAYPEEGIEKAKALGPDLVFISLLFSDSNGLKLSKLIRSVEGLKEVPVVMLISYQGELDPKYTSTIGVVDVLVKPLTREEIVSKTVKVLGEAAISDVAETVIAEETFVAEEQEAVEDEEAAVPRTVATETEDFSLGSDDDGVRPADDEIIAGAGVEGEEGISRGISGKMTARKEILAAGAVLIIALIVLSVYGLKKFFYPTGNAPISSPETVKETTGMRETAPAGGQPAGAYSGDDEEGDVQTREGKPASSAGRDRGKAAEKTTSFSPAVHDKQKNATVFSAKVQPQKKARNAAGKEFVFSVQVGAFGREQNAAALIGKLKKKGYDAFTARDDVRQVYRVLVGRFSDRSRASQQADLLRKEGIKSIIFRSKG